MKTQRLWGRAFICLSSILSMGCVIVPVPGSVDEIKGAAGGSELAVEPGEGIAVIGPRGVDEDSEGIECVRNEIKEAAEELSLDVRVIGDSQFQEALYPWFDPVRRPESIDALASLLGDVEVKAKIESLKLRYLIYISSERTEGEFKGPALPHLGGGVGYYDVDLEVSADMWDLKDGVSKGKVLINASGDGTFLGYGFYGLWTNPKPMWAACRSLGRTLAVLVAGAELPEDLRAHAEKEIVEKAESISRAEEGDREAALALASEFDDLTYLKALALKGDREAAVILASEFDDATALRDLAEGGDLEASKELLKVTGETTGVLIELAKSGDLAAATLLARHADDLEPLRSLAESGKYEAIYILVEEFEQDDYVEMLAEEGNYVAAYERYQHLRSKSGITPSQFLAAWRWLCLSANAGYSKAQAKVGYWHRSTSWDNWRGWNEEDLDLLRRAGVQSDTRIAYMWYTLASSSGDESAQYARDYYVADQLTKEQTAEAEQMVRDWKPGDCPSKEHRLGPPDET